MIDEKKLIEDIRSRNYINKALAEIFETIIDEQPQANEWIPCSERLPEKPKFCDKGYLVQEKHVREPFSAYWDGSKWFDIDGEVIDEILAWQPLPEPYKEGLK